MQKMFLLSNRDGKEYTLIAFGKKNYCAILCIQCTDSAFKNSIILNKMNNIQHIIEEIKRLEKELIIEMENKEDEFFYKIQGKKNFFEEEAKKYQKNFM